MRKRVFLLGLLLVSALLYGRALQADAQTEDEKEIRALVQRLVTAAKAKDVRVKKRGRQIRRDVFPGRLLWNSPIMDSPPGTQPQPCAGG